jgi:hypothetical protein
VTWLWLVIVLAVVLVAAGALVPVVTGRDRRAGGGGAAIAARDRYALLGSFVEDPAATTDTEAEALLAQARERWLSAGALLAGARSAADFTLAERTAREGLAKVATAHARMGIPGPS